MHRKFYTILKENNKSLAVVSEDTQIIALQPAGERPPFFIVESYPNFIDVIQLIGCDQPVLCLIGFEDTQDERYAIADEADVHIKTMLARQPHGPYMLGGCSVVQGTMEVCKVSASDHLEIFKSELDRMLVARTLRRNISEVAGESTRCLSSGVVESTGLSVSGHS